MSELAATDDLELLRQFTRDHSQAAFTALVQRHVNLVYSAALRQVRSPQLAEEVTQSVFADLACNAAELKPDTVVVAWLHAVTRRTAVDVIRKESRRQLREQIAVEMNAMNATEACWTEIEPFLDEAVAALDETDRAAVLLRYFENQSLRAVGQQLGVSDDAAQKRVTRAVERLREFFAKRGVSVGAGGLVVVISANAVQAAPVGLAVTISAAALAGTAATTSTLIAATTKTIAMTTLQKTLVTVTVAVLAGAGIYEARQAAQLRDQVQTLQQQQAPLAEQMRQLQESRDAAADKAAWLTDEVDKNRQNNLELLKLRAQVTALGKDLKTAKQATALGTNESDTTDYSLDSTVGRINFLKRQLKLHPGLSIPEIENLNDDDWMHSISPGLNHIPLDDEAGLQQALSTIRLTAKQKFAQRLANALKSFAGDNSGNLPASPTELKRYLDEQKTFQGAPKFFPLSRSGVPANFPPQLMGQNPPVEIATLNRYQMVQSGNTNSLRPEQYVLIEKNPVDEQFDTLIEIGINNFFVHGTGQNASMIGWSGTPDVAAMTPEQRKRYEESSARQEVWEKSRKLTEQTPEEKEFERKFMEHMTPEEKANYKKITGQ